MSNYFSFSQSEAKKFLENSKTAVRVLGLKLVVERKKKPDANSSPELPPPAPTEDPTHGKLLIVIPRRVANSCGRNLIRRRIKAFYAEQQLFKNNTRYALFVYPEAKKMSYGQLTEFLGANLKNTR